MVWLALAVAAAAIVITTSNRIEDTDFWQHLAVGRAIAELHRIPVTQLWSWPTYGAPDVNYAWGFEALAWPFWKLGGIPGLFLLRWLATLSAFGILWAAARRMGARGLSALPALVLAALVYRQRSDIRPEIVAAILFALEVWILETRRHGGRDRSLGLLLIAWGWSNVHISFVFGLAYLGFHALDASLGRRAPPTAGTERHGARGLWLLCGGWVLVSLLNPFGWRVLSQPFEYFFVWRHEPIYRSIAELYGIDWKSNLRNLAPLLLLGWPLLALARWRRRGLDLVEALTCAMFLALAFSTQRFIGNFALASAAYLARDLDDFLSRFPWPAWLARPAPRALAASLACVALGLPLWTWALQPVALDVQWKFYPVAAADFMAAHDVRGRAFNHFELGGYLLHRFWPERERLPFIEIHQAGTREDRLRYQRALEGTEGWRAADAHYDFEYALLHRVPLPGHRLPDVLDRDSSWAAVFMDDAATLYVKRGSRLDPVARAFGYRVLPAGPERLAEVGRASVSDSGLRPRLRGELERMAAGSRWNAVANSLLASLDFLEGDDASARPRLERALAVDPFFTSAHERLGMIHLRAGRPREALEEFRKERSLGVAGRTMDLQMAFAWQRLGNLRRARDAYRRTLRLGVGGQEARDSLERVEAKLR